MWVSSVLNKDIKQFGKQFIFDNQDHTSWNSDQGSPQWIIIEFPREVKIKEVLIQFQGGFVGKDCELESKLISEEKYEKLQDIYPQDVNSYQSFSISNQKSLKYLKITFKSSTDFYGRIIVYKLNVMGNLA